MVAARAAAVGNAASAQPQQPAGAGARRDGEAHLAVEGGHPHLAAQHRHFQRHRHLTVEIAPPALEPGIGPHADPHPQIAAPAGPRLAHAGKPQHRAVFGPRRDVDLDRAPIGKAQPPAAAAHGLGEVEHELRLEIGPAAEAAAEAEAEPARAAAGVEELLHQLLEVGEAAAKAAAGSGMAPAEAAEAAGKGALAPVLVDLAPVIAPPALGIAEDLIGRRDLLKAPLGHRVAGVEVGMPALGKPPVGAADLLIRRVAIDSEDVVERSAHAGGSALGHRSFDVDALAVASRAPKAPLSAPAPVCGAWPQGRSFPPPPDAPAGRRPH